MTNLHARDRSRYRVSILCGLLGVSKQAYYKHSEDAVLLKAAQDTCSAHDRLQPRSADIPQSREVVHSHCAQPAVGQRHNIHDDNA